MRRIRSGVGWLVALLAVTAVGSAGAQLPTPLPGETLGPPALLASAGAATTGPVPAIRACWGVGGGNGRLCFDDFPTGDEPLLPVRPGAVISMGFAANAPLTISVSRLDANRARLPVVSTDPHLFIADFPLGVHDIFVTTTWTQGSADYLFRVEVGPAPPTRPPLDRTG
jgi:hypothetical protein